MTGIEVTRLAGACGAEIGGVELSDNLGDNVIGDSARPCSIIKSSFFAIRP
jgi:hypothetical protein